MRKFIILFLFLSILVISGQTVKAVLTDQAPAKFQTTINTSTTQNIKQTQKKNNKGDTEIEAYKKKVKEILDADVAKWRPLTWSKDLTTEIEFGLAENGRLNYSIVKKSSGQSWFDDSVKNLPLKIFDPLPASFKGSCPRMYNTSYGDRKCLVMTYTVTQKAKMPEGYVKPKSETDKNQEDHVKDMQKSIDDLFK